MPARCGSGPAGIAGLIRDTGIGTRHGDRIDGAPETGYWIYMKKTEADKIARQIFAEAADKTITVLKELNKAGKMKHRGIDGEKPPEIRAIDEKLDRMIKELADQIDDWPVHPSQEQRRFARAK